MARPLRIAYEGAFYHVTARGNDRKKVFLSQSDYDRFLTTLKDSLHKYEVILHAYVLMGNHYHLLIETPRGNISAFMQSLNTAYTTYFNRKRRRIGHLFQGRYKALLIEADSYLLQLSRYIHLNPVTAKIVERPEDYPYSSYRAFIDPKRETLAFRHLIWSMVTSQKELAPVRYAGYVMSSGMSNPFERVYGGAILGNGQFIKAILKDLREETIGNTETSGKRVLRATTHLEQIIHVIAAHFRIDPTAVPTASPYKSYAVFLTRKHTALSNVEIGKQFGGISCSAVTKIGTRLKDAIGKDRKLRGLMDKLEINLSRVNG